jgi:hypothetical protein
VQVLEPPAGAGSAAGGASAAAAAASLAVNSYSYKYVKQGVRGLTGVQLKSERPFLLRPVTG